MFDDRNGEQGDLVTKENEYEFREMFANEVGHTMECVEETVEEMGKVLAGVCDMHGAPIQEILKQISVEQFDKHLRAILEQKDCDCKK